MLTTLNWCSPSMLVQALHRLVQRARLRRADLEAAGVDEAHQQRLAAVVRTGAPGGPAVEQRGVGTWRPIAASAASAQPRSSSAGTVPGARGCRVGAPKRRKRSTATSECGQGAADEPVSPRAVAGRGECRNHQRSAASMTTAASSALSCTIEAKNAAIAVCGWAGAPAHASCAGSARRRPARPRKTIQPAPKKIGSSDTATSSNGAAMHDARGTRRAHHHRQHGHAGGRILRLVGDGQAPEVRRRPQEQHQSPAAAPAGRPAGSPRRRRPARQSCRPARR